MYQSKMKKTVSDPYIFVKAVWWWKKFEIFALLGRHAAWNGSFFTDVSGQCIGPILKGRVPKGADKTPCQGKMFFFQI
jgi:hypothetical protein